MKTIIIMTNDNKLLLSKDETSEKLITDLSLDIIEFSENELIIKLKNDYISQGNVEVRNN